MKVAEICPVCATYINATCIIYAGEYLSTLDVEPLETLESALLKVNNTFTALSGEGVPSGVPKFVGQLYIDTDNDNLWVALSVSPVNWGLVGPISTTTTTTTA